MSSTRASRLIRLRDDADLTLEEAAAAIGMSRQTIYRYESDNKSKIRASVLEKLAKIYKTTVEYIETGRAATVKPAPGLLDEFMFIDQNDAEFIDLPFIEPKAYGTFSNSCHDRNYGDFATIRIQRRPGKDYTNAAVIEVRGNSMADRYPDRSQHVVRPVSDGNFQYATGVHALSLRSPAFLIKRIVSNVNGTIRLRSDSNGEEMEITLGDINCLWKVGESVYMPEEE
ncbi:LexA family transcriptional regulator [Hymenobacter pini]|uniref:LexA family transcriptional regulator n=1 Tax=Hymenobacter pini TaxID=2880879 RepID=UPI001CF4B329|nr:XRE family transcriptional regulator [Hymenobacter pini]MCA8829401.1 helix-turn-helix domain-containing protein [Hymenobacter pini]